MAAACRCSCIAGVRPRRSAMLRPPPPPLILQVSRRRFIGLFIANTRRTGRRGLPHSLAVVVAVVTVVVVVVLAAVFSRSRLGDLAVGQCCEMSLIWINTEYNMCTCIYIYISVLVCVRMLIDAVIGGTGRGVRWRRRRGGGKKALQQQ